MAHPCREAAQALEHLALPAVADDAAECCYRPAAVLEVDATRPQQGLGAALRCCRSHTEVVAAELGVQGGVVVAGAGAGGRVPRA